MLKIALVLAAIVLGLWIFFYVTGGASSAEKGFASIGCILKSAGGC